MKGFLSEDSQLQTLRQILQRLRETYCGNIGYEYMHIQTATSVTGCASASRRSAEPYFKERKKVLLDRLAWSDMFKNFLSNKYSGETVRSGGVVSSPGSRRPSTKPRSWASSL